MWMCRAACDCERYNDGRLTSLRAWNAEVAEVDVRDETNSFYGDNRSRSFKYCADHSGFRTVTKPDTPTNLTSVPSLIETIPSQSTECCISEVEHYDFGTLQLSHFLCHELNMWGHGDYGRAL